MPRRLEHAALLVMLLAACGDGDDPPCKTSRDCNACSLDFVPTDRPRTDEIGCIAWCVVTREDCSTSTAYYACQPAECG